MTKMISRREFNELLGSGALAMDFGGRKAVASDNGDVGWVSDDPHLSGNYLPVEREIDADNLPVIAGRIPLDLSGAYMRNGPNPLFKADLLCLSNGRRRHDPRTLFRERPGSIPQPLRPNRWPQGRAPSWPCHLWQFHAPGSDRSGAHRPG